MSWSIGCSENIKTRDEHIADIEAYFKPLIEQNFGEPWASEYQGARDMLVMMLRSMPDAAYHLYARGYAFEFQSGDERKRGGEVRVELSSRG